METLHNKYDEYRDMIMLNSNEVMPDSRKLERNTYLELRNDRQDVAVKLHKTDVIIFHPDGSIELDSGGWRTPTTKDRMNGYLPNGIWVTQKDNVWYVHNRNLHQTVLFEDGMVIAPDGTLPDSSTSEDEVHQKCQQIKDYAKEFVRKLFAGKIPKPSGGDCWMCCMADKEGKTMGDMSDPISSHLEAHLEEGYHVPSLLMNAIKEQPVAPVVEYSLHEIWVEEKDPSERIFGVDIAKKQIQVAIENYYRQRYSLPQTKANY